MTITREKAIETATLFAKKKGYGSYLFCGAQFHDSFSGNKELPFLKPTPAQWVVRFINERRPGEVCIDDGDEVFCVKIDAVSVKPSRVKGM